MTKPKAENEESTLGFKDKQKAMDSLKILEGRDISYQYNVISGLIRRAKRVLEITKNEEKISNIRDAVNIFNEWLDDYKQSKRSKENFAYLPLETVEAYRTLGKCYGVLEEKFFRAYEGENGDYKCLRNVKVPNGEITWDIERNQRLKEITAKIKDENMPWYKVDNSIYQTLPTEEHVQCILLGYSPEPTKIKKLIPQVIEICRDSNNTVVALDNAKKGRKRQNEENPSSEISNIGGKKRKHLP